MPVGGSPVAGVPPGGAPQPGIGMGSGGKGIVWAEATCSRPALSAAPKAKAINVRVGFMRAKVGG